MPRWANLIKTNEVNVTTAPCVYKSPEGQAKCLSVYQAALAQWPVSYRESDIPTRFGSTHIIASGSQNAPPLVLLHGNWTTAMMWSSVIAGLSRDFSTYAIDQIDDVGKSIPTRVPASRLEYAEWLLEVFDRLGLPQAHVAGLSYGGFLAANFALFAPDRVKRLVLLCPGIPSFGPPTRKYVLHGLPLIFFPSYLTGKWLIRGLSVRGYRTHDLHNEQLIVSAMNLRSRIPFRPVFDDDEFGNLKMPALLLIGEQEALYNARSAVDYARQHIPHIETEIIPNAGHMLTIDQPEVVMGRILQFLHGNSAC